MEKLRNLRCLVQVGPGSYLVCNLDCNLDPEDSPITFIVQYNKESHDCVHCAVIV